MKILLVSTSDRKGGAAIACYRIFKALKKNGADVSMLVRDKISDDKDIYTINTNIFWKVLNFTAFCIERLLILFHLKFRRENLFQVSLDNLGAANLLRHPLVKEAGVINFHWTSQGMLSLRQLEKLLKKNRRIVFTMHDMHSFTGICHYAKECKNYMTGCGNCVFLGKKTKENDLSKRRFFRKTRIEHRERLVFVGCSNWLAETAQKSTLLKDNRIFSVPNPINTEIFRPLDKESAKKKFNLTKKYVILFGAAKFSDERKGFSYLVEALKIIYDENPEVGKEIQLLVFGEGDLNIIRTLPFDCKTAGYLESEKDLARLYNAADVFVTPSLEDNLPNTVMEALSCGVPCAAFDTGGLSQLIDDGINGCLAELKNSKDLAAGIIKILTDSNYAALSHNARSKVENCFSEAVVAMKYNGVYRTALIQSTTVPSSASRL